MFAVEIKFTMADIEEHILDCERLLGRGWREVHEWVDEFITVDGARKHRKRRHHRKGIEEARAKWGDEAALAAEIHIRRDFHGYLPECPEEWGITVGWWDELRDDKLVDERWMESVLRKNEGKLGERF
jgi:hypothetical protein